MNRTACRTCIGTLIFFLLAVVVFLDRFGYTAAILISVVSNDIFGILRGQINKYVFAPCVSHNSYLKQQKSKWPHGIYEKVYGVVSDAAVFAD